MPCLKLFLIFGSLLSSVHAYSPMENGPPPEVHDFEWSLPSGRSLPVRLFLPAQKAPAPVILFSHGLGGSREGSNYLGQHWSSRGYVTVFLQHPGSDESVWKEQPRFHRLAAMKKAASVKQFRNRIRDVHGTIDILEKFNRSPDSPLHNRLDLNVVGMSGHSFGAKTTQAVSGELFGKGGRFANFRDLRIDAALPMSPSPQKRADPEESFGTVEIPWLVMTGTEDGSPSAITDTSPADRLRVFPALPPGDKYELVLDGGQHMAFTDRDSRGNKKQRNPNHHRVILATSTAFWDAYLKKNPDAREWLQNDARQVMEPADRWQMK